MYTVHSILYTVYSLYTVYCAEDTVLYTVNGTIYCTRYTVYIILYRYDSIPLVPVPIELHSGGKKVSNVPVVNHNC